MIKEKENWFVMNVRLYEYLVKALFFFKMFF